MRLFIAVNLPEEIKNNILEARDSLERENADAKWAAGENYHITLKFLGEVKEETIPAITGAMAAAAEGFGQFEVSFSGIGGFPDIIRPKVIWAGVEDGADRLKSLAEKVDLEVSKLGFKPEKRPFSAHLTIARVRSLRNINGLTKKIEQYEKSGFGKYTLNEIFLMQSTLSLQGPVYTCLKCVSV